jgi:hypothetical protein
MLSTALRLRAAAAAAPSRRHRSSSSSSSGCCAAARAAAARASASAHATRRDGPRPRAASTMASAAPSSSSPSSFPVAGIFFLDDFAARQWDDPNYAGTRVPPAGSLGKQAFVDAVAAAHSAASSSSPLVDGYAPFCKHVFMPNVLGCQVGCLPITDANRPLLRSGYTRRRPEELPVLTRWFKEADVAPLPKAKFLDVILYSREQLEKEYLAMPTKSSSGGDDGGAEGPGGAGGGGGGGNKGLDAIRALPKECVWGIISVKAQDEPHETPMQPITMLRNALGREEGGSGVSLDRAAYEASASYWEEHAAVVASESPSGE